MMEPTGVFHFIAVVRVVIGVINGLCGVVVFHVEDRLERKSSCLTELCRHDLVGWWVTLHEPGNDKQTERNIDAFLLACIVF